MLIACTTKSKTSVYQIYFPDHCYRVKEVMHTTYKTKGADSFSIITVEKYVDILLWFSQLSSQNRRK